MFCKKKAKFSVGQTGPPHKGLHRIMFDVGFDKNVFKKYVLCKTKHKPMKTIWRTSHFLYPEHSYGASLMCQTLSINKSESIFFMKISENLFNIYLPHFRYKTPNLY